MQRELVRFLIVTFAAAIVLVAFVPHLSDLVTFALVGLFGALWLRIWPRVERHLFRHDHDMPDHHAGRLPG